MDQTVPKIAENMTGEIYIYHIYLLYAIHLSTPPGLIMIRPGGKAGRGG